MRRTLLAIFAVAAASLGAQDAPHFEVVSIKPSPRLGPRQAPAGPTGFQPGGRYVAHNLAAGRLLVLAFRPDGLGNGLRPEQIIDAPAWMNSTQYDIEARVAGPASATRIVDPEATALLRSLLEDRFKLNAHFEKRELPFYALIVVRPDMLGPNLKKNDLDCDAIARERDAARRENRAPQLPPGKNLCSLMSGQGTAVSMTTLATMLTGITGTTVLDRTGLTGGYDVDLHYAQEARGGAANAAAPSDDPSVFTAVQEQLGLKLEQRREPRDVLVIDHIEKPTED